MVKPRPKKGDRVEFRLGAHKNAVEGTIIGVSEVGVHYLIQMDNGRMKRRGLSHIVRIIDEEVKQ